MEPFKNIFNEAFVSLLATYLKARYSDFDIDRFEKSVFQDDFENKELKQRMRHITHCLKQFLPQNFTEASDLLIAISPKLEGLANMVLPDFVEVYGIDDFDQSMKALEVFTKHGSSEFGVRPFMVKYPQRMMQQMYNWSKSSNEHVRRLSSEGSRPRLPWAMSLPLLKKDPKPLLELLENLKDDPSEYVRRSVANNLNDISKDHPSFVLDVAKSWIGKSKERDWLVKHGCRTLLKAGDTQALTIFNYSNPDSMELSNFELDSKVKLGEKLSFSFTIDSPKELQKLRLEFAIYFLKKNGKLSKKVFKISESICKKYSKSVSKYFSFRPITTRVYYKGVHELSIIVNGKEFDKKQFTLI
ncbi:MAG: DNA alkylation repair protein [Candidatus Cloacimonetes bacterium]|nr:DNA alkylation repair protein [Candidatus Cloacimonadota bacterium]